MFAVNQLGLIWKKSEECARRERLRFEHIYELVEKYMVEANKNTQGRRDRRMIVGGSMGVNLLLGRPRSNDDFQYTIYTEDSLKHSNTLTNEIAKVIKEKYDDKFVVYMRTVIPNIKYEINIDMRALVTIFTLKSDVKSYELIEPVTVKSFDRKHDLLALSPEMHLINVYRTLSSPAESGQWEATLKDERRLFCLLRDRLKILGGDDKDSASGKNTHLTKSEKDKLEGVLLEHFVSNNEECVLVGEHAYKLAHKKDLIMSSSVIHVISAKSVGEDVGKIRDVVRKAFGRNIPVTYQTRSVNVMQDFRIMRTSIRVGCDSSTKEVMYIYNSAAFDLTPYNTISSGDTQIRIGNPFVLMRFFLIDLWVIRWVREMKKINEFFAKKRINSILQMITDLRGTMSHDRTQEKNVAINDKYYAKDDLPLNVFQRSRYIGVHIDEIITLKRNASKSTKRFFNYYPQGYFTKNNSYRTL